MLYAALAALLLCTPADARSERRSRPGGAPSAAQSATPVATPAPAVDPEAVMAELAFLAGRWRGPLGPDTLFDATYTASEGGTVLSASRTLEAGRATGFEFERFAIVDGVVTLTPYPNGRAAVPFVYAPAESAASLPPDTRRAVFVNPTHDYPTEITYARTGAGAEARLVITLSGRASGSPDVMVFDLARVE